MSDFFRKWSDAAYRHASNRNILLLAATVLAFYLFVFPQFLEQISPGGDPPVLDLQPGFSPEQARETLDAFGEQGRQAYLRMLLLADTIFPVVYGLLLILLSSRALRHCIPEGSFWRILNLAALDAVVFDFCENAGIACMLLLFPEESMFAARFASVCGLLKWLVIMLVAAMILAGWACSMRRRHNRQHLNQ